MNTPLANLYTEHHATKRGESFTLLGDKRGALLRHYLGTGKQILDIGCRDGALTKTYMEGNTVTGFDIDPEALARAGKLGIKTQQVDLNGDWPTEKYDAVVMAETLEHLYYPEKIVAKIADVLKPGGILVGSVPNAFSIKNRVKYLFLNKHWTPMEDPTHINQFIVKELQSVLETKFKNVRIHGLGRLVWLAKHFPQEFAFDLFFYGEKI